jgi:DNA segregation ATPase FtsK/SpoIIIE, S-DNA-T family
MTTIAPGAFPFSMFDPVHLGIDENGEHVYVDLAERNMLLGGGPGGGKSSGLNLITAHGALSYDCKLILVDGKQVELGPWRHCADMFIGPSIKDAIEAFESFQATMDARYKTLLATGRRKIVRDSGEHVYLIVIDEYAYFSATVGAKTEREKFAALTRDLVARGRAAGVIIILATQRPSHQVIDPSMRDLFGYRWAFRCTTDSSSDVVFGQGWASEGYTAADIDPWHGASVSCCRRPGRRAGSKPPTSPTRTWPTSPATPPGCGTQARQHEPPTRPDPLPGLLTSGQLWPPRQCQSPVDGKPAPAAGRQRRVRQLRPPRPARYARRVAMGDIDALAAMTDLSTEIDSAIGQAVTGLRGFGYSWAEIGIRLGITRQAAQQRWGTPA